MPSATEQVTPSHIDSTHSSYSDTKVISEVGPRMTQPSSETQTKFCGNPVAVPKMTLTLQDNIFKEGDGKVFATLMDFMYTGKIEFSHGTIAEAHDMVWKIKLSSVIEMCEDYITEAYDNYELDLKSALQISRYSYLHEKSQCYVTRNFDSLVKKYPEQASKRYLLEQLDKQKRLKESVRYFPYNWTFIDIFDKTVIHTVQKQKKVNQNFPPETIYCIVRNTSFSLINTSPFETNC